MTLPHGLSSLNPGSVNAAVQAATLGKLSRLAAYLRLPQSYLDQVKHLMINIIMLEILTPI